MEQLREANGAGRLGLHVQAEISSVLAGMGLGHVPQELPTYQHEQVRLCKRGTAVGTFIETVLAPGQQNDTVIVEKFADHGVDYAAVIKQIRDLVAE